MLTWFPIHACCMDDMDIVPRPCLPAVGFWEFVAERLDGLNALGGQVEVFVLAHPFLSHPPAPSLPSLLRHALLEHIDASDQLFLQGDEAHTGHVIYKYVAWHAYI